MDSTVPLTFEATKGRVDRVRGPDGAVQYSMTWDADGKLARLSARLPDQRWLELVAGHEPHPVIGDCDAIRLRGDDEALAYCGRVAWHRPDRIPPLDRPGALPRGGGAVFLNVLAAQAAYAGVEALRYHGPYPTHMLFDSLLASFDVVGDPAAAREAFVVGAERAAVAGRPVDPPIAFVARPHALVWTADDVCVQQRDGIERAWIRGFAFDRRAGEGRLLVPDDDGTLRARVVVGGTTVAEIVRLSADGVPSGAVGDLPAAPADLVGAPLPEEVVAVLGEAIAADASPLLSSAIVEAMAPGTVRWGDPGLALVAASDDGVVVHAGIVAHLPTDPMRLLGVLVGLMGWPVRQLAQRRLSLAAETILRR